MHLKHLLLSTTLLLLIGCKEAPKETTKPETMETKADERPLEALLNEKKANFEASAPEDKKKTYAEGITSVEESHVVNNALQVGEVAVNFSLPNAGGKEVTLYDALKKGPVILMWYRGGWCPYCNLTLHQMQESLPEFKKYGATLMAVSPEVPDSTMTTKEKNALAFEVLSDVDNAVARKYKVVYTLTDGVAKIYEANFKLSNYNGNTKGELPLAATYIIGQDKVIKYAFLDADYRNRAEPKDLVKVLKELH